MRKFIVSILLFSLLFVAGLVGLEWLSEKLGNDTYAIRDKELTLRGDEIKTVFLGTSLTYWGVDPSLWPEPAYNLGFNLAILELDYEVLKSELPKMPNLKMVVLELPYMAFVEYSLEEINKDWVWMAPTIYMHTTKYGRFSKNGFWICKPELMREKILPWMVRYPFDTDRYGHTHVNPASKVNFEGVKHRDWAYELDYGDEKYIPRNVADFRRILELCQSKGIEVTVVFPPAYFATKIDHEIKQISDLLKIVEEIRKEYPFRLIDYMYDRRFTVYDTFDGYHLSTDVGAEKYTKFLIEDIVNDTASTIVHK